MNIITPDGLRIEKNAVYKLKNGRLCFVYSQQEISCFYLSAVYLDAVKYPGVNPFFEVSQKIDEFAELFSDDKAFIESISLLIRSTQTYHFDDMSIDKYIFSYGSNYIFETVFGVKLKKSDIESSVPNYYWMETVGEEKIRYKRYFDDGSPVENLSLKSFGQIVRCKVPYIASVIR